MGVNATLAFVSTPEVHSFFAGLGSESLSHEARAAVAQQLAILHARAKEQWPQLEVDTNGFFVYWGSKIAGTDLPLTETLLKIEVEDLYLAYACAQGDSEAISAFEHAYFTAIAPALSRLGLQHVGDEVVQQVRNKLFVGTGEASSRIADLAGNGSLRALVRLIAVRSALNLKRQDRRNEKLGDGEMANLLMLEELPDQELINAEQRVLFKFAFQDALANLEGQERAVLRLHLLHHMNISEIADLYDVHRATTARWLGTIRNQLGQQTRTYLRKECKLETVELDSLLQMARSMIDISFDRILGHSTDSE